MSFQADMQTLLAPLEQDKHAEAVAKLKRCRRVSDLDRLADTDIGWLEPGDRNPRLRLVKHGSGTFLLLSYDDGWGTTLSQAGFHR